MLKRIVITRALIGSAVLFGGLLVVAHSIAREQIAQSSETVASVTQEVPPSGI